MDIILRKIQANVGYTSIYTYPLEGKLTCSPVDSNMKPTIRNIPMLYIVSPNCMYVYYRQEFDYSRATNVKDIP